MRERGIFWACVGDEILLFFHERIQEFGGLLKAVHTCQIGTISSVSPIIFRSQSVSITCLVKKKNPINTASFQSKKRYPFLRKELISDVEINLSGQRVRRKKGGSSFFPFFSIFSFFLPMNWVSLKRRHHVWQHQKIQSSKLALKRRTEKPNFLRHPIKISSSNNQKNTLKSSRLEKAVEKITMK